MTKTKKSYSLTTLTSLLLAASGLFLAAAAHATPTQQLAIVYSPTPLDAPALSEHHYILDIASTPIPDDATLQLSKPYTQLLAANDPGEPQTYLSILAAEDVWDQTTGSSSTVVAVIDSGFALGHEDLLGRWALNAGEQGTTTSEGPTPNCTSQSLSLDKSCNNLDDDGNGFVDDWRGWDFAQNDNDPQAGTTDPSDSGSAHGTGVAGLVGATGNNSTGVASINWSTQIMPLQVFTDSGVATTLEVAQAIDYALDNGATVINMSLGASGADPVIEAQLETAKSNGVVVVTSAGNCGNSAFALNGCTFQGQVTFPATDPNAIAVAATNLTDERASFSSYGSTVDVAAPGTGGVVSTSYSQTNPTDRYASVSGTSFSSPITAGAAALIQAVWPAANAQDVRASLVDTTEKVTDMNGAFFTDEFGFGRIRPLEAIAQAQACAPVLLDGDINCDGIIDLIDFSLLAGQWQLERSGRTDIDQSGQTDLVDFSILAGTWQEVSV